MRLRLLALVCVLLTGFAAHAADDEDRLPSSVDNPESVCHALDHVDSLMKSRPDEVMPMVATVTGILGGVAAAGGTATVIIRNILNKRAAMREVTAMMSFTSAMVNATTRQALLTAQKAAAGTAARDAFVADMTILSRKMPPAGYFKQLNPVTVQRELTAVLQSPQFKAAVAKVADEAGSLGMFAKNACSPEVLERLGTKLASLAQAQLIEKAGTGAVREVIEMALGKASSAFVSGLAKVGARALSVAETAGEGAAVLGPLGIVAGAVIDVALSEGTSEAMTPEIYARAYPYMLLKGGQYSGRIRNADGSCDPTSRPIGDPVIRHEILVLNGMLTDTLPPEEPKQPEELACFQPAPNAASSASGECRSSSCQAQSFAVDPQSNSVSAVPAQVKQLPTDTTSAPVSRDPSANDAK